MRVRLRADASGAVRLAVLPEAKRKPRGEVAARSSLVYGAELQDCIYAPEKPVPVGFGRLAEKRSFTRLGKQRVREVGAIVDSGPLTNLVFLTGTLPGSTSEAQRALAEWSGWLVSRLQQWLRDKFGTVSVFGVWEYQKRGALHLHLVVRCPSPLDARLLKSGWKRRWISLLDGIETRTGVDVYKRKDGSSWRHARWVTRTDAQSVEQSVTRYLSKYCAKSADKLRGQSAFPPSAWWFASKSLRSAAAAQRLSLEVSKLSLAQAGKLFESVSAFAVECASVSYPVFNDWDKRQRGVICLLPPPAARVLVDITVLRLACFGFAPTVESGSRIASVRRARAVFAGIVLG